MKNTRGSGKVIPGAEKLLEHMHEDPHVALHLMHLVG